jgi:transcriptional regulator with XRE-family HTH domain
MTLKKYMKVNGITLRSLAVKSGIPAETLCRYSNGKRLPSMKAAYAIYIATGKKVNLKDWIEGDKDDSNMQEF